jgi:hypothetical protein
MSSRSDTESSDEPNENKTEHGHSGKIGTEAGTFGNESHAENRKERRTRPPGRLGATVAGQTETRPPVLLALKWASLGRTAA